ncbi:phosphotriesterase family protein [Salipaludibacillus aurantiacus]|uniref:Phosphotriesterase-related protein n=1 Tax=Salipaludibacillus aurantiacus TaxID=1601833 RepID=A0A1H9U9W5_9BACI|nr:phosphotriesterase [Salipaludibacillus aurantiacus]SES05883.1 phosphotriesterase-related protein [Salipaludibacillus aurantiacus]
MFIQTVRGRIDSKELGICAAHEHLSIDLSRIKKDPDTILDDEEGAIEEVKAFAKSGGEAIIEVTNDGMGRDAERLKRISEAADVHIVACTGFYKDPFIPSFAQGWEAERFAEHFIKEAEEGIEGTSIYPGIIGEVGTSKNEMKPVEKELLTGAAKAGLVTGLPVTTHTTLGTLGKEQMMLFDKLGLPPEQIIIGHQDLNPDDEEVLEVLETGTYIGFDTIGKTNYRPDSDRMASLIKFVEAGCEDQILLSADLTRKSHWKKYNGPGYGLVLDYFIPEFKKKGADDTLIHKLLVKNPARAFSINK